MKFRVLYDLDRLDDALPCGVIVDEGKAGVRIIAPWSLGLPERISDPYPVTGLDLATITYMPGHPDYFGHIAHTIHRSFALGREHDTARPADYPEDRRTLEGG